MRAAIRIERRRTEPLEITVRFMSIPLFPDLIEIPDFEHLVRTRIIDGSIHGEQALALLGYMGWPNDPEARAIAIERIRGWKDGLKIMPKRLLTIQRDWGRVCDIFNIHMALTAGGHQQRRGGPSVGKAIEVVHARIKARGARKANLWRAWQDYKDVAHLVAAATMIAGNARDWAKVKPIGRYGYDSYRLQSFLITLLMPEFVLALAMTLQVYGLSQTSEGSEEPMLDPETLWRIPPDMNVMPISPPERKITSEELLVLNARRAGNRGRKGGRDEVDEGHEADVQID